MKQVTIVEDSSSQHDQGGYLCTGINTSLSFQESWHLPPSLIPQSRGARLVRVWPARLLLPAFLLSCNSFYLFTHLQPDGLLTEMESQAQQSKQHPHVPRSQAPSLRNLFHTVVYGYQPMCLPSMESTTTEESTIGKGPTGGGPRHWRPKKKTEAHSLLVTV